MTVVIVVSRRLGHVILATSWRTSCKNLKGLTLAIVPIPIVADCNSLPRPTRLRPLPYPRRCGEGKGGGCREKCRQPHTAAAAPILDGRDRSRAFLWGCDRGGSLKRDRRRRHYVVPMASKIKSAVNMDSAKQARRLGTTLIIVIGFIESPSRACPMAATVPQTGEQIGEGRPCAQSLSKNISGLQR